MSALAKAGAASRKSIVYTEELEFDDEGGMRIVITPPPPIPELRRVRFARDDSTEHRTKAY
jgi:hypothetical protein